MYYSNFRTGIPPVLFVELVPQWNTRTVRTVHMYHDVIPSRYVYYTSGKLGRATAARRAYVHGWPGRAGRRRAA
eukprot:COSAG02_NODE_41756_length_391_cov_0.890411_1_plen_73_part_10